MRRSTTSPLRFTAAAATSAAALALLSGCLVSSKSSTTMTGSYVGSNAFDQIEPGETTEDWLLAVVGSPTSRTELEDGAEVWKWSHMKTSQSSGSVLFLFGGSSSDVCIGSTCVELRDGVVAKKWRD